MGVMYFNASTPTASLEVDAAKSPSEQGLSRRNASHCSVASLANSAWAAQKPHGNK